jgi:hypothetical protein
MSLNPARWALVRQAGALRAARSSSLVGSLNGCLSLSIHYPNHLHEKGKRAMPIVWFAAPSSQGPIPSFGSATRFRPRVFTVFEQYIFKQWTTHGQTLFGG